MMNQEDLFRKIGLILSELQDQYEYLAQNTKQLNELELELFLANASFLTDHVQILQKINGSKAITAIPEHTEVNPEELPQNTTIVPPPELNKEETPKEIIQPTLQDEIFKLDNEPSSFSFILNDKASSDKFEFEEKSVGDIFDRPLSEEERQILLQKQKTHVHQEEESDEEAPLKKESDDEIGPEPFLVSKNEGTLFNAEEAPVEPPVEEELPPLPANEKLPTEQEEPLPAEEPSVSIPETTVKPTLNELLASSLNVNKNLNTENTRAAITDLKQGITLNQKLLYIKDLFNGYNLAYAEVIDLINKMPDFKTVDSFLQKNYAVKNNWAAKQDTVDQFYELLHQRFPPVG